MIHLKELMILLRDNNKYQLQYFKDNRHSTIRLTLNYLNNFLLLKFHFKDNHPLLNFPNNLFHNFQIYNRNLQIFNINKDHKYINNMIQEISPNQYFKDNNKYPITIKRYQYKEPEVPNHNN